MKDCFICSPKGDDFTKYLLIGRTGVGRHTLADLLTLCDLHVSDVYFRKDYENACQDEIITVETSDNKYFFKKSDIETADACLINPDMLNGILDAFPDTSFHIVYIETPYDELRVEMAAKRLAGSDEELEKFNLQNDSENEMFTEFEKLLDSNTPIRDNCRAIHKVENDFSDGRLDEWAAYLKNCKIQFDRMIKIVNTCLENNILNHGESPDTVKCAFHKPESTMPHDICYKNVPVELFADSLFADKEGFNAILTEYLRIPSALGLD